MKPGYTQDGGVLEAMLAGGRPEWILMKKDAGLSEIEEESRVEVKDKRGV